MEFVHELQTAAFWIGLWQIILVNIVLSGDNAVVIALAARSLPPKQQKAAIFWGSGAAIVMRIFLTIVAVELLRLPYLKLVGAALLLWIAVGLLLPEDEGEDGGPQTGNLGSAIRTILIADLVMSLDNVIAVAAASRDSIVLLLLGLAVSIPLIVWSSQIILHFMERYPVIISLGAGLLGYVAGGMMVTDVAVRDWADTLLPGANYVAGAIGALAVVVAGRWLARRKGVSEKDYPVV
jgi:YjbE family integral membrane protein